MRRAGGVRPELSGLELGDPPELWTALGFSVAYGDSTPLDRDIGANNSRRSHTGTCDVGGVRLSLGCPGEGITGWTLSGIAIADDEIDGLRTGVAESTAHALAPDHPNGAVAVDHVVVTASDFDRTAGALEAAGMPLRRVAERRDGRRMGFRRLGPAILELVEVDGAERGPARFWGLVVVVEDLDALADRLDERLGSVRAAVQPGRRIATLRQSAGLGEKVAFMSPVKAGH